MSESEPKYPSPESQMSKLRFAEGWREILEAPDAFDYQKWLSGFTDLTSERIGEDRANSNEILAAWLEALEQVADITIDPEEMEAMTQAQIVETALVTLQTNLEAIGWDDEGIAFTVPNMFTGEEASIDLRGLLDSK